VVGPVSSEERSDATFRLKIGFVVLIGLSSGLISLQGDLPLWGTGVAILVGLVLGVLLVWLVFPGTGESRSSRGRR
jgi:hypothetical protein